MLSIDALNPIKVVTSVIGISPSWGAWLSVATFMGMIYVNSKEILYIMVKTFMTSILTIFFSSIEVLGKENIPYHGPVIFAGNHNNQFVDGAVVMVTCPRQIGFLIAEKSYKKRIIGDLAKAANAIPVTRPQDLARKGPGQIMFEGNIMRGKGTKFTEIPKGDKVLAGKCPDPFKIQDVISDEEAILAVDANGNDPSKAEEFQGNWVNYSLLAYVDQGKMFDEVYKNLARGKSLAIFPEGGSHDNTDLLPLKVGVSAIAYGVFDKYDVNVPIVPVGLNYFRGHRFRGRIVVEFGKPVTISNDLLVKYKQKGSKREALSTLLEDVEDGMRSVIVTAPDYAELRLIHTIRRMYQHTGSQGITTQMRQDLARRFAVGYRALMTKYNGVLPEELVSLQMKLRAYERELDACGLKDYQVNNMEIPYRKLLYTFVHGLVVLSLAFIPSMFLNAPVGLLASRYAVKEAQAALEASRVKVKGLDVLMSKRIVFCLVAVPILWVTYALILLIFSTLQSKTVLVLFLSMPVFSYFGITAVEAYMVDIRDLWPAFIRLLPSFRKKANELPAMRAELQKELREIVKKYGPEMGPLYYDKSSGWEEHYKGSKSTPSSPPKDGKVA
jgi:glycerol-3-phosphate O-acyltransferase/dihydroxyacetone phosphate acyltransferase